VFSIRMKKAWCECGSPADPLLSQKILCLFIA